MCHGFTRPIDFLIARGDMTGAVNLAAPNPLPYAEFMRELRRAAGVRIGLPATKLMLEIGARLMRTETELVLKSRRVVPARLLAAGFEFTYPEWPAAARDLVSRA
jgi:NAD dependent epimerase/dehydratase family enzyme